MPVFSVDTEDEARTLIVLTCPRGDDGNYYARELVEEQSLENLQAFSDKLAKGYEFMKQRQAQNDQDRENQREYRSRSIAARKLKQIRKAKRR